MMADLINDFCVSLPISHGRQMVLNCLDRSVWVTSSDACERGSQSNQVNKRYGLTTFCKWFDAITNDCCEVKAVIFLTNRCNLACRYCFQDGYSRNKSRDLTRDTAERIISWISEVGRLNKSKVVHLYLYGGEPSLNAKLVEYISTEGKDSLERDGLKAIGHMFTNGVKLNGKIFSAIKSGFIQSLQITLDGMPEVHDRRRPYKGKQGTFRDILANVKRIVDESDAEIIILSNFDRENKDSVKELHGYLGDMGLTERLFFTFNPVFKTPYNCRHCNLYALPDNECYRVWSGLLAQTYKKGFRCNPLPIFDKGPCSYWRRSHFVFDTTGDIYKCIGMPGMKEFSIGNVASLSPESIGQLPAYGISGLVWDNNTCKNCPYLPLCLGGCRFHALVEYGDVKKPYCHKELIEQCEFETIKKIYGDVQI